jgi:transposase
LAKILSDQRVVEYSVEFKIKVIDLTERLNVTAVQIAEALGLHPIMVYRWRQEYREGKFVAQPTRRISMTKELGEKPAVTKEISEKEKSELKRLRQELAKLKKENDFLKKWDGYLKAQKQRDSDL